RSATAPARQAEELGCPRTRRHPRLLHHRRHRHPPHQHLLLPQAPGSPQGPSI
ncbi:hypothetical protein LTR39_001672, partial [Cryomyces antarcticus]